ncbi:SGNH/GDSL hydrolase family protein [Actinokineospora soli]|uniref:SGNH/GDSL hydrolase family protein n=1 Tax=Actinokineospora soli TaxID=1048753 RepID=A0ABW2TH60_9PSEU
MPRTARPDRDVRRVDRGVAVAEGERYVALGDSYSAGTGAGGHYGSCYRSRKAYPRLWAQANQPASFAFAACGGATTDTVIAKQVNALADDTTLVTITIGGNDVGFGSVMRTCTLGSDRACLDRVAQGVAATEQVLPAKLDAAYRAIEERRRGRGWSCSGTRTCSRTGRRRAA